MSGHANFIKIGSGNIPQPIINNVPVAGNVANTNGAGNVQGGSNPQPPEKKPPCAADFAGQLDVLFLKAAKSVAVGVDAKGVETAAQSAALPKATVKKLKSLAETAQKNIVKLDGFTGHDLAAAMVKKQDGTIDWKPKDAAAKALKAAQDSQVALSSAIADILGQARDAATQAALEEIMLQCDRRVSEIEMLVMQMSEIVEKGGDKVQEDADKLAGGKLSSFTSEGTLDKFDRGRALAALNTELKPLVDRLAGYAQGNAKSLTEADVTSCTQELNALKAKLSAAATSGKIEVGDKTVFCDRSMLAEASRLLDGVGDKIASMHRDIVTNTMVNFVEHSMPFLKGDIFSERFVEDLAKLRDYYDNVANLALFVRQMNVFRNAAMAFAKSPTPENKAALVSAAEACKDIDLSRAGDDLDQDFFASARPAPHASEEFKKALAKFKEEIAGSDGKQFIDGLKKIVKSNYKHLDIAVEQLLGLGKRLEAGPENKIYVSSWVLGAFRGEQTVSSLVEARVHGYNDSEIDARIDDANVAKSRKLGSGSFNTVTLVTLKDGSEWVFKPEMPGLLMAPHSSHFEGLSKSAQMTRINITVNDTADVLGLNDVMVTTKAGTHEGEFGMFMERAPGLPCSKYCSSGTKDVGAGKLSMVGIRTLDEEKFGKVVGRLMRQANRLQWFDIITGQGDRHNNNYMVDIDKETLDVTIKGIDNDASYGVLRTGLKTYTFPADSSAQRAFWQMLNKLGISSGRKNSFLATMLKDPGLTFHDDGTIDIDLDKVTNKRVVQGLLHICGMRNVGVPEEIDRDLYDKLMALAPDAPDGGAKRAAHLDSLATRLGADSDQYRVAVKRLDESIAHARKLMAAGKVYTAEQWETRDVQKSVAKVALKQESYPVGVPRPNATDMDAIKIRSDYVGCTNYAMRDLHKALTSSGYHKNWFK